MGVQYLEKMLQV